MSKVKEVYFKHYYKRFQVQIVNTKFLLLDYLVADKCLDHIIQILYFLLAWNQFLNTGAKMIG